ncbi:chaperone protein [Stylonychia lemnae]|uniref:Chaperone protein n=1 Tax=Stylonychia lemnae TaxID=5949 RepID=A0A078AIF3_STYLE|nr:chaperone protein [Stylonychia lemnae]|eukprot:CDW82025.1 chaperone protein [Stylonychia lemnae]
MICVEILGVKSDSSDKEIKQAYFKLAKKYHPDLNPGQEARSKFDQVSKAYEVLSDNTKKDSYDQQMGFGKTNMNDFNYNQTARSGSRSAGTYSDDEYQNVYQDKRTKPKRDPGYQQNNWQFNEKAGEQFRKDSEDHANAKQHATKEDFAKKVWDEFDDFFQFNDTNSHSRDDTKGADYKADIEIEFMDAVKGQAEMNKRVICYSCKGMKAKLGSQPRKCFECGGRGSIIGNYGIRKKSNQVNRDCEGLGVQRQVIKEDVELPPGVNDGQKLKVMGIGHASDVFQGSPGDLLLHIKVKEHTIFKRENQNIISDVALNLSQAILGCKLTIETLEGKINIEVNPGVINGQEMILKNLGIQPFHPPDNYDINSLRGDHIIRFRVQLPSKLTEEQKELLKEFQKHEAQNKDKYYERNNPFQQNQSHQQSSKQEAQQNQYKSQKKEAQDGGGFFSTFKSIFK